MIQELELTHRHHMARPSPGIPLQIKICLHSFVFFCDDIGSLTFNRGRNTASDELQTQTQWRLWVKISAALWESAVTLCCVAFFIHLPPWRCVCVLCMWGPSVQARPGIPHDRPGRLTPAPGPGLGGRAQSWQRRRSGDTVTSDQGKVDTEETRIILYTVSLWHQQRIQTRVTVTRRGSHHLQWEISGSVYRWSAGVW